MKVVEFGSMKIFKNALNDVVEFGKHKYKIWKDVINEDVEYIDWCFDNIKKFDLDDEAKSYYRNKKMSNENE